MWGVPRDKKIGSAELLGTFRTGTSDATTPPAAPNVHDAEVLHPIGSCPDFITTIGTPAQSAGEDVLLAAWLSDAQGHLVYDRPPDQLFAWHAGNPEIDRWYMHKGPRRLGLRAVDVTGSVGPATELDVKTR